MPDVSVVEAAPRSGTRQRVLDAALRLFGERGYAATSVRDIAEELGISKAAVHYHFPAKEQMVAALLQPALDRVDALVAAALQHDHSGRPPDDPRGLLAAVQQAWLQAGATMHVLASDPSMVEVANIKAHADATAERVVAALVGPAPSPARQVRGHCAMGALFAGMVGLVRGTCAAADADGGVPSAPVAAPAPTPTELEAVLDAAVAALG